MVVPSNLWFNYFEERAIGDPLVSAFPSPVATYENTGANPPNQRRFYEIAETDPSINSAVPSPATGRQLELNDKLANCIDTFDLSTPFNERVFVGFRVHESKGRARLALLSMNAIANGIQLQSVRIYTYEELQFINRDVTPNTLAPHVAVEVDNITAARDPSQRGTLLGDLYGLYGFNRPVVIPGLADVVPGANASAVLDWQVCSINGLTRVFLAIVDAANPPTPMP